MKLKAIIHENDYHLATESGEIIENSESCEIDWSGFKAEAQGPITITFKVRAIYGNPGKVVDADEQPVKSLPAPEIEHDYDPDEGPFFYDDEEEVDFMEGLCPDCAQELCLRCGQCKTPACEAEGCDCP
jgi:hypothetical protein